MAGGGQWPGCGEAQRHSSVLARQEDASGLVFSSVLFAVRFDSFVLCSFIFFVRF